MNGEKRQHISLSSITAVVHYHMACWPLTPDPLAPLRNLLASGVGSGFFFKKDLAPSSPASPSLSEDEPWRAKNRIHFIDLSDSIKPL